MYSKNLWIESEDQSIFLRGAQEWHSESGEPEKNNYSIIIKSNILYKIQLCNFLRNYKKKMKIVRRRYEMKLETMNNK